MDCNNCNTHKAVARCEDFCNVCEYDYYADLNRVFRRQYRGVNPKQLIADEIMKEFNINNKEGL